MDIERGYHVVDKLGTWLRLEEAVVAGGFVLWMVEETPQWRPTDVDVWPLGTQEYDRVVDRFQQDAKVRVVGDTPQGYKFEVPEIPFVVNVIKPTKAALTKSEVLERFDLGICQVGIDPHNFRLVYTQVFLDSFVRDELVVCNTDSPVHTLTRVVKYSKRGYVITPNELLEAIKRVRSLSESEFQSELDYYELYGDDSGEGVDLVF